ncbi:hypothetical protein ACFXPZ_04115 [Streptomyces sp. NPDC059101]|uniref:hypothetical protein n=1 Tax=Streptomyces sp. NPDC059101 TaxID=3346728 RepID=UPI00368EAA29
MVGGPTPAQAQAQAHAMTLARERTCRELAEETGFSLGMISYLGRRHDLPGRRPAQKR